MKGQGNVRSPESGKKTSDTMLEFGARLDALAMDAKDVLSDEEFGRFRKAIGRIMGAMLLDMMNPLYAAHPALKSRELR
jgi:hypothetical protein